MSFTFKARIYKVGINPCVKVPLSITGKMQAARGYIPVTGTMEDHFFRQTLVPVKDDNYRLFVNGPMLKATSKKVGDAAKFTIEQDKAIKALRIPEPLRAKLNEHRLLAAFKKLTPYRQKEIIRYLSNLKTVGALNRNIGKVINQLIRIE